jgi:hypothetical protein
MLVIVIIGLSVSLLIVFGIGLVALLHVAFSGSPELQDNSSWQPPLARRNDLLAWAAGMANAVAARRLQGPRGKDTARQLATEIYQGSSDAISHSPGAALPLKPHCTSGRQQLIGVTAPEALTIADALCASRGKREVKQIHDVAAANAAAADGLDQEQHRQARRACPLLSLDSTCVVYEARPVRCRGCCPLVGKRASLDGADENSDACDPNADAIGRGAAEGLSRALGAVGLDADIYELNSALATALETPNAAQRWANGERIFTGCHACA